MKYTILLILLMVSVAYATLDNSRFLVYYDFDNSTVDSTGYKNINIINGATNVSQGITSSAINITGTNAYAYAPSLNYNDTTFTIGCWYNLPGHVDGGGLMSIVNHTSNDYQNGTMLGKVFTTSESPWTVLYAESNHDGASTDMLGSSLNYNTWQHLALRFNGTSVDLFLNGTLTGSRTRVANNMIGMNDFHLAARYYTSTARNFYKDLSLDECWIYKDEMEQADIQTIVNNNKAGTGYPFVQSAINTHTINIIDLFDDNALDGVTVTLGGDTNTTVGGTATFYNKNGWQQFNATKANYYSITGYVNVNSSATGNMTQAVYTNVTISKLVTGEALETPFNITVQNGKTYELNGATTNIYLRNGQMNFTAWKAEWYNLSFSKNVTAGVNTTTTTNGAYNTYLNVSVQNIYTNTSINGAYLEIGNINYSYALAWITNTNVTTPYETGIIANIYGEATNFHNNSVNLSVTTTPYETYNLQLIPYWNKQINSTDENGNPVFSTCVIDNETYSGYAFNVSTYNSTSIYCYDTLYYQEYNSTLLNNTITEIIIRRPIQLIVTFSQAISYTLLDSNGYIQTGNNTTILIPQYDLAIGTVKIMYRYYNGSCQFVPNSYEYYNNWETEINVTIDVLKLCEDNDDANAFWLLVQTDTGVPLSNVDVYISELQQVSNYTFKTYENITARLLTNNKEPSLVYLNYSSNYIFSIYKEGYTAIPKYIQFRTDAELSATTRDDPYIIQLSIADDFTFNGLEVYITPSIITNTTDEVKLEIYRIDTSKVYFDTSFLNITHPEYWRELGGYYGAWVQMRSENSDSFYYILQNGIHFDANNASNTTTRVLYLKDGIWNLEIGQLGKRIDYGEAPQINISSYRNSISLAWIYFIALLLITITIKYIMQKEETGYIIFSVGAILGILFSSYLAILGGFMIINYALGIIRKMLGSDEI